MTLQHLNELTPELDKRTGIKPINVTVVGQGYIGLPLSVSIATAGHTVFAVESDLGRLDQLQKGQSYIADVTDDMLSSVVNSGNFRPTPSISSVKHSDIYLIAVPTPVRSSNQPNLDYIDAAIALIASIASPGVLVVIESTTYPGALRNHIAPLFERLSGLTVGVDVHFAYSPQRIDPGREGMVQAVPKLVSALDHSGLARALYFYEQIYEQVVPVINCEVAEFAKLFENTFRYVNIAFVNEMAKSAYLMGVDFRQVVAAASSKPYGFMPFNHGPGVGGHCLPNNIHYLQHAIEKAGGKSELVQAAAAINNSMPAYTVKRLESCLERVGKTLEGSRVLLLGLTYKQGVADTRNSPTFAISDLIVEAGGKPYVADPSAESAGISGSFVFVTLTAEECAAADAVLIITHHPEFDYSMIVNSSKLVLDCQGNLDSAPVEQL